MWEWAASGRVGLVILGGVLGCERQSSLPADISLLLGNFGASKAQRPGGHLRSSMAQGPPPRQRDLPFRHRSPRLPGVHPA